MIKTAFKFELIDKIIVAVIVISSLVAILGTIIWVNYKYKKANLVNNQNIVNTSAGYNYNLVDNKLYFYENKNLVSEYTCNGVCSIEAQKEDQFSINYKPIALIHDDDKYVLYNVETASVMHILDYYPLKVGSISNYGKIIKSKKYGIINNKSGLVLDVVYDLIENEDKYLITLSNGKINIYNESITKINNNELKVKNIKDIMITKKDNYLILNLTLNNKKIALYKYNIVTNNFE